MRRFVRFRPKRLKLLEKAVTSRIVLFLRIILSLRFIREASSLFLVKISAMKLSKPPTCQLLRSTVITQHDEPCHPQKGLSLQETSLPTGKKRTSRNFFPSSIPVALSIQMTTAQPTSRNSTKSGQTRPTRALQLSFAESWKRSVLVRLLKEQEVFVGGLKVSNG